MQPDKLFSKEEQQLIVDAVKEAELNTSGEIRVHIDGVCKDEVLDCAANVFAKLDMHKTKLRNGVLFYLAVKSQKFAVIGDAGINKVVPDDFWDKITEKAVGHFKDGQFAQGLCQGVLEAGAQLKEHFPYQSDDVNELSDDISFGKK